jgi:hypothetical protein
LGFVDQTLANPFNELTTWESRDGRTIVARVIALSSDAKTAEFERADGLRFTLAWDRFSDADQARLKAAAKEQSQKPDASGNKPLTTEPVEESAMLAELPESIELDDVPMIQQKGNYCVPASAAMIANFHGIETDQDQVAELSSEMSASNQGTYPGDMLLAMQKLGFNGHTLHWKTEDDFFKTALPQIRRALFETGPIYISFKPNVFGAMGHGCVIIGYDDRKKELRFHNPWGHSFDKEYGRVAIDGYGVVFIEAPAPAPVASEAFISRIQAALPEFDGDSLALATRLERIGIAHELVWCSRRDARNDRRFARDTARDDGRMILELAFERNPAVIIPHSENGETQFYQFVTRPPEGGAQFLVRRINADGWSETELQTLGSLTRYWTTAFQIEGQREKVWELPMIELQPIPGL